MRVSVPVIAIDGPSASGKGTVASRVAQTLGFHYLDSGALYRLTALAARQAGIPLHETQAPLHETQLAACAAGLDVRFEGQQIVVHRLSSRLEDTKFIFDGIRSQLAHRRRTGLHIEDFLFHAVKGCQ